MDGRAFRRWLMKRPMALLMRAIGRRSCEDVVATLQDYFDGTLDPGLAATITRHFRNCPDCRAFRKTYGKTIRLIGKLAGDDIPDEVRRRVRSALHERRGASGK